MSLGRSLDTIMEDKSQVMGCMRAEGEQSDCMCLDWREEEEEGRG